MAETDLTKLDRDEIHRKMVETCDNYTSSFETGENYCPGELDGWNLCWNATPPGEIARQPCPKNNNASAFRECTLNGTWFVHPDSIDGKPWTNYTQCIDKEMLAFSKKINLLYEIGYSVSLVTLILSLAIFFLFRSLKCTRIRLHIHLFISLALNNIAWIVWYELVIFKAGDDSRILENPFWCQAVFVLRTYFMITNYTWMFCEALYLHISLVVVFVRDEVAMKWFLAIGWGFPVILIFKYCMFRIYYFKDNDFCWIHETQSQLILTIPVCISLIISLVFLINVLKVILNVMHPRSTDPSVAGIRRAARAAAILIPLFGLHFLLMPFKPDQKSKYQYIYEYVSAVLISFQGLFVSCIFCFANHDVHTAIRGFIHRQIHTSRWSNYYYTGAVDSAGVYVINSTNSQSNNLALI